MSLTSVRSETPEDSLLSILRETEFGRCSPDELRELENACVIKEGRRRDIICEQSTAFPYLGVVLSGVIAMSVRGAVSSQRQTRSMRLYEAFPGQMFGEVAVLDDAMTLGRVSVITRSARYALIPRDFMETM